MLSLILAFLSITIAIVWSFVFFVFLSNWDQSKQNIWFKNEKISQEC